MRKLQDSVAQAAAWVPSSGYVITLGNFDGVHIGHRTLIQRAKEESEKRSLPLLIFTFCPHSGEIVEGRKTERIYTDEQKFELFQQITPEADVLFFAFDEKLRDMPEDVFFEKILMERCRAKVIVVGENFRYGKGGCGNVETLKQHCEQQKIDIYPISGVHQDGEWISSTRIRRLLKEGKVKDAGNLLGSAYYAEGVVQHGKRLGRKMGFPTVNLFLPEGLTEPRHGVYVTKVSTPDGVYAGVSNVGVNPTVEHGHKIKIETHILDYTGDLYDQRIRVEFLYWMRDEQRFDGIEQLMTQLQQDIREARNYITAAQAAEWRKL